MGTGGEVTGIDHVQLAMPEGGEDAARAFYAGVLGLAEVAKPAHLAVNGGCWFAGGTAHIHLGVEREFRPARKAHPALLIDDLDRFAARLEAAGVAFTPGKPLDGYVRGDIADPFGNRIELMQLL
ncbi:VOC family protein [Pelagerythrobacter marensis]|uniref:Putative glyoxalase/bleomycin resistance protein/dioxygenase n=1 Tax=Pelagerythrobacter marensis TaxID=543877 RepID=A0A0G3X893_9SPHN|nr:VOC family protein [Pelagerythrobacter marensis]AKM07770.1 Putative glyoxalase/bleomycin resistance protein/dioxygenase [Pelagerythrobacter marensis]